MESKDKNVIDKPQSGAGLIQFRAEIILFNKTHELIGIEISHMAAHVILGNFWN